MIKFMCPDCGAKLKAPDGSEGKATSCPKCGTRVTIEPIMDAEIIDDRPPRNLHDEDDGSAYDLKDDEPGFKPGPGSSPGGFAEPARKPCPACGEMIVANAAKCRFCGEIFDPALKRAEKKRKRSQNPDDESPTVSDWVIAILCPGIGCIGGAIYMMQGKPKGGKVLLAAVCAATAYTVIRLVLEGMNP